MTSACVVGAEGTLILREVAAEAVQQQLLLGWLDQNRMHVVSITSESRFSLVERGVAAAGGLDLSAFPARTQLRTIYANDK
jgi:hypothetical protein